MTSVPVAAAVIAWSFGLPAARPPGAASSRWFVVQPDVEQPDGAFPLVSVKAGVISRCDRACVRTIRKGAGVRPVRGDGSLAGDVRVTGILHSDTEPFDEVLLTAPPHADLLVSDGYQPRPTAMVTPTGDVQRALNAFVASVDALTIDQSVKIKGCLKPAAPRTTVFRFTAAGERERVVTVAAGPALAVADLNARGQWVLQHLEQAPAQDSVEAEAFQVLAVVDMDGDGVPEIVALRRLDESWWHLVLRYTPDGDAGAWTVAARVYGSTV